MIGTVTPTIRPISGANMPPALTTMSARISRRSPLCSTVTPVTRPRSVPIATTRVCGRICAPRARAPAASALARPGRVEPAVGRQPDGAEDAVGRHQREAVLGLAGADQLERQAERLGPAGLAAQLLEPLRASTPAAASRPRATTGPSRSRRPGAGTARCRTSSSWSASPSPAAGRPGRPSGTSSPRSARRDRPGRCRSSRARRGGRRSRSRRRRRR